ncbi:hydroxylase [Bradyrhizobium sp. SK17]|uniref:acyl-CoA dehydrogenase family protein n=1 Tax=Bradyrhizobium sp. SK17 TaxID=2057741 RepID=UPI000C318D21|nr:acyl-CoA dehydrogenase family protein [Bradyrhizobium sp. SK17]AUC95092.1 hydroxylase [Bradyrhizobium sp. SK17]
MTDVTSSFVDVAAALAPLVQASAEESERLRRLPVPLVEAMAQAGLFRLWIPRTIGGAEADPMTLVRVVEEISRADGAAGWCMAIGGVYGVFGGYLAKDAAHEIYGSDPTVRTAGALRPMGTARVVDGGYHVTGRWPLGSGCQHSGWMIGNCRIFDGDQPRLQLDGMPVMRIMLFPTAQCEIFDTWHSIGLRGTGSHDYAVAGAFVPSARSLSFRELPVEQGPLYAFPTIALFGAALAAVPLGIARHAIDILVGLVGRKIASRSRKLLSEDALVQADLGRAEALLGSGRAFLHGKLAEAWQAVSAGKVLSVAERATLWLASTHAANAAKQATELMFEAGGSASLDVSCGLERCVRDVHAAVQHLALAPANYQMAGQAYLGVDMRSTPLLFSDDRDEARSRSPAL